MIAAAVALGAKASGACALHTHSVPTVGTLDRHSSLLLFATHPIESVSGGSG